MMKHTKHEEDPIMRLTEDLIHEILLRLPPKSLINCKLVSKKWNSLISDPDFAMSHLEYSIHNNRPLSLAAQKHNFFSKLEFKDSYDITQGVRLTPADNQFPADKCDGYFCFLIGSCDGLVCFYLKTKERRGEDLMFIWNPATGERKEIALPHRKTYLHEDSCWFGYIHSINDYKIVLVCSVAFEERMYVYSFRNPRWREIHGTNESGSFINSRYNSVFMEEALHCLTGRGGDRWICKFDLVAETFERVPLSINESELLRKSRQTLLGVIEEDDCLCLMFVEYPPVQLENSDAEEDEDSEEDLEQEEEKQERVLELWVLQEYNKWDSWKRFYRLDLPERIFSSPIKALGFTYGGIVCIQADDGLRLFDPSDDPPSYAVVRDYNYAKVYRVANYVESLLSPFDLP